MLTKSFFPQNFFLGFFPPRKFKQRGPSIFPPRRAPPRHLDRVYVWFFYSELRGVVHYGWLKSMCLFSSELRGVVHYGWLRAVHVTYFIAATTSLLTIIALSLDRSENMFLKMINKWLGTTPILDIESQYIRQSPKNIGSLPAIFSKQCQIANQFDSLRQKHANTSYIQQYSTSLQGTLSTKYCQSLVNSGSLWHKLLVSTQIFWRLLGFAGDYQYLLETSWDYQDSRCLLETSGDFRHLLDPHLQVFSRNDFSLWPTLFIRYMCIMHPSKYTRWLHKRSCLIISLLIWLLSTSASSVYFALDYINYLMLFAHVTMAAGVLIFIGMNL